MSEEITQTELLEPAEVNVIDSDDVVTTDEQQQLEKIFMEESKIQAGEFPQEPVTPTVKTEDNVTKLKTEDIKKSDKSSQDNVFKETPVKEEPETIESLSKKLEEMKKSHENYRSLNDKHTAELGTLRQFYNEYSPVDEALRNDPQARNSIFATLRGEIPDNRLKKSQIDLSDYDPSDPVSIEKIIDAKMTQKERDLAEKQRMEQANNLRNRFQSSSFASANTLIEKGHTSDEISNAEKSFMNQFMAGEFPIMAIKLANYDKAVEQAKKEGREEALNGLRNVNAQAKTLSSVSSASSPKAGEEELDNMNAQQLLNELNKTEAGTSRFKAIKRIISSDKFG